ncbi:MAG: hypothetical protein II561_05760, partial [Thermoguttaceae bacterium]|nr:hypothetical protein [Thermoguttaceae bacterium]
VSAKSEIEQIVLSWRAPDSLGSFPVRYKVCRQVGCGSEGEETLTPTPIYGTAFTDKSAPVGVDCVYKVVAVSRVGAESEPSVCSGRAKAAPKTDLFTAPFAADLTAAVSDGETASSDAPRIAGAPSVQNGALAIGAGQYLAYPNRPGYNSSRKFTLELDVTFDEPGVMPVVVGFGSWNKSGWFLQRFQGKWRFHFAGVDCDSTAEVPVGKEIRVVATYDGERLRIFQDGLLVGERACAAALTPWSGELFVGQYSADQSAPYQFVGKIRNVKILNYVQ